MIREFELLYQKPEIKDWAEFGSLVDNIPIYKIDYPDCDNPDDLYVYVLYNINKDSNFYHSIHVLIDDQIYKISRTLEEFISGLQNTDCPVQYITSYMHYEEL